MSNQSLNIYYEGNHYKDGKIDIKEFAPSLLAFGEIIEESNKIINKNKAEIKTYITADFEKKCFKCKLSLESNNILQSAKNLFGLKETLNIQELLELLGFVGTGTAGTVITSYVAYKLIEKGRKVKKHTILQDGNVELTIDETVVKIEFNLFKLIKASWQKKSSIQKNFNKHLNNSKGEIGYSTNADDKEISKITKECKEAILMDDSNLERQEATQDPITTNLIVRMADYYGDIKWTFLYVGKTIKPDFSDELKEKLMEMRKDVKYNSKLPVEMIIAYEKDDNGEVITGTEQYRILKITGELIQETDYNED